jgi:RNA polymerase sigma factor (sigma-70 family)
VNESDPASVDRSWRKAFTHLWPVACRAARRLLANQADVEDIAATALAHYAQLPARPANLDESGALVAVIARRAAIAHWRRQTTRKRSSEETIPLHLLAESELPGETASLGQAHDMEQLLQTLPPLRRQIICEHFLEGRNSTEIGERLGLNPITVRSHLLRAMQELRKL